ncbi:methylated-DNA--[protein]-cysteine S-methyltransferase [Kitasatospora phosalacinea]|uniref:Methylated-DNA--protein-cysteine methyltransferase n=1 Tax=Kitasatospora phosalacinea TaxID=2065 RepID=A0ABW6GF33_9ACTN
MTTAPAATTVFATMDSPLGTLLLSGPRAADGTFALGAVTAPGQKGALATPAAGWEPDADALAPAVAQLTAYFAGERTAFDLPLAPVGTPFRQQVWDALDDIPYGTTLTYGQLADAAGQPPRAVRAVGGAVGANPLLIVRPCHRVMGANGSLTGFAAGIDAKRWLLAHESSERGGRLF